jgi:hypothetical protein
MRLRSIGVVSVLAVLGLVVAVQVAHAQGMTPGQAAPPLPTLDLTKPGSPRPSAQTLPQASAPAPVTTASAKVPPAAARAKPTTVAKTTTPPKKTTTKAPPKTAKGRPAAKPTQTATTGDR